MATPSIGHVRPSKGLPLTPAKPGLGSDARPRRLVPARQRCRRCYRREFCRAACRPAECGPARPKLCRLGRAARVNGGDGRAKNWAALPRQAILDILG